MYRSASLGISSDSVAMHPPGRPLSRAAAPVLKLACPTENGSVFGDTKNVYSLKSSDEVVSPAVPIKTSDNEIPKRKAKGVDMRQPVRKIRLLEFFSETVKLLVGAHRKIFLVHKDMICVASPFFEAGFKPQWQKSGECIMELPEDDPTYFAPVLYWVYNNKVVCPTHDTRMTVEALSRIYCLAEKYQMPRLQNDLIDAMVYEIVTREQYICTSELNHIFRNSPPSSKLRLLAVNCTLTNWKSFDVKSWKQTGLNADLVFDIFLAFNKDPRAALRKTFLDSEYQYCELYHIHEAEQQGKCESLKLSEHVCADMSS
ncbi:hypothetical protein EYC80_007940 [Monilinia laxa]|uniref:BTB domain-containing protein n=1 Tax=Monilinia laxa TaxID=61186 RepID=A0A5N6JSZ7_MONLA|nr:hypothetical protein EYC80_007940 [Monilinia laxa]